MSLKDWQEKARKTIEAAAPYIKRIGTWFTVNVVVPVAYATKEIVIEIIVTLATGGRLTWELMLEPALERISEFFGWLIDEIAKALRWLWELITPWNK